MRSLLPPLALLAACSATSQLEALAGDGTECASDGDCCVVYSCWGSYVVGEGDFSHAKDLAQDATDAGGCPKCGGPGPTDVRCNPASKRCEGRTFEPFVEPEPSFYDALGVAHCGAVAEEPWPDATGQAVFGCGG